MEREIKIVYIPKEETGEDKGCFKISCGEVSAYGDSLEYAIQVFDTKFERYIRLSK